TSPLPAGLGFGQGHGAAGRRGARLAAADRPSCRWWTTDGLGLGLVGCGLGEQLQEARPAAATGDPITERLAVNQPVEQPVFQLDGGLSGAVGAEADLDLAGVLGIGVVLPLAVDLPGDDEAMWWLPGQHLAPVALAAVGA